MLLLATETHADWRWVEVLCLTSVGLLLKTFRDLGSQVDIQEEVCEATNHNLQTQ